MARYFEKISFEQFKKDVCDDKELYDSFKLPARSTTNSAGYDFFSIIEYDLKVNESLLIPLGIKANMNSDEVLFLVNRSGLGTKYNIRLCNQIGVIDADYYNNENNEGHLFVKIKNEGTENLKIEKGMKIIQGIFIKYLTVDDDEVNNIRTGGFGSTGK